MWEYPQADLQLAPGSLALSPAQLCKCEIVVRVGAQRVQAARSLEQALGAIELTLVKKDSPQLEMRPAITRILRNLLESQLLVERGFRRGVAESMEVAHVMDRNH